MGLLAITTPSSGKNPEKVQLSLLQQQKRLNSALLCATNDGTVRGETFLFFLRSQHCRSLEKEKKDG